MNPRDAASEKCAVGAEEGLVQLWVGSTSVISLIEPESCELEIEIAVRTLDTVVERQFPNREITRPKIKAECAGLEVFAGAKTKSAPTAVEAVEAGPERLSKISAPAVLNALFVRGFEIVVAFITRRTFLLRSRTRG